MLKIVVFDNGSGGELFADQLEAELPVAEIIRVTDRQCSSRKSAEKALEPYIGTVDLIVLANYLLAATSLSHLRGKYRQQKFIGFTLKPRRMAPSKNTLFITTKATTKSFHFFITVRQAHARVICLDDAATKLKNGDQSIETFENDLKTAAKKLSHFSPEQIMLAHGHFTPFASACRGVFGKNVRVIDSFDDTVREVFKTLRLRNYTKKKDK